VKYETTQPFDADWDRLSLEEQRLFLQVVREINRLYAQRGAHPLPPWPAHLRIKPVRGHAGVWEITWSFAGPDGRATFEFLTVDGEPAIRWRRIGHHDIFRKP
jgi:hypothetical protein